MLTRVSLRSSPAMRGRHTSTTDVAKSPCQGHVTRQSGHGRGRVGWEEFSSLCTGMCESDPECLSVRRSTTNRRQPRESFTIFTAVHHHVSGEDGWDRRLWEKRYNREMTCCDEQWRNCDNNSAIRAEHGEKSDFSIKWFLNEAVVKLSAL